jgi:hypothetical protein
VVDVGSNLRTAACDAPANAKKQNAQTKNDVIEERVFMLSL